MMEIGRICVKLAGRDSNKKCVIIGVINENYVMIDGQTRRRKCNVKHLEPLPQTIKIKKNATRSEVVKQFNKLKIEVKETKPRKRTERPKKKRKKKVYEAKKEKKEEKKPEKKEKKKPEKKETKKKTVKKETPKKKTTKKKTKKK